MTGPIIIVVHSFYTLVKKFGLFSGNWKIWVALAFKNGQFKTLNNACHDDKPVCLYFFSDIDNLFFMSLIHCNSSRFSFQRCGEDIYKLRPRPI